MAPESAHMPPAPTRRLDRPAHSAGPVRLPRGPLGKRLLITFCVLAVVATAANLKLVWDLHNTTVVPAASIAGQPEGDPENRHGPMLQTTQNTRKGLLLLIGITVVCLVAMIYLLLSRVIVPLEAVTGAVRGMAEGDLSSTAPQGSDESGELGRAVNDLASNFQEVLLLTGTVVGTSNEAVGRIEDALAKQGISRSNEIQVHMSALKKDLDMLGAMVKDFQYYQTHFNGQQVVHDESRSDR